MCSPLQQDYIYGLCFLVSQSHLHFLLFLSQSKVITYFKSSNLSFQRQPLETLLTESPKIYLKQRNLQSTSLLLKFRRLYCLPITESAILVLYKHPQHTHVGTHFSLHPPNVVNMSYFLDNPVLMIWKYCLKTGLWGTVTAF